MRRILLSFLVLIVMTLGASAQYTYNVTLHTGAGNPGGLRTSSDASTTGYSTVITGSAAANSWSDTVAIPFAFNFYGTPVTHFKVSGNGVVTFDTSATAIPADINTNLPASSAISNIPDMSILGFWDSFSGAPPLGSNDQVWVGVEGTAPNRQQWIHYFSYEYGNSGTSAQSSFTYWAIVLEEGTDKVYIVDMNYHSGGTSLTTTLGVQKDSIVAVQYGDSTLAMMSGSSGNTDNDYYEFSPFLLVNDNAGITSIDEPFAPLATGLQDVKVTLKNHGANTLTSATINWAVNGVAQTPFAWTGSLASQASVTTPITLGQYNFGLGNFDIEAWTSLPNGVTDNDPSNDTTSLELCSPLSGTMTIGGMGATYATIQGAIDALSNCGIGGPITFNIAAGTYNEALTLPDLIGASSTNTITFNGAGAGSTIISYDGSGTQNATVLFDGADHVTFKNVTIDRALGGSYNWGVRMQNASDFNTFDSCTIKVDNNSTSSLYIPFLTTNSATSSATQGNNANSTTISNCSIEGGYYGIRFYGQSSGYNFNNRVINTHITDQYYYGIYSYYQDSMTISGNVIEDARQGSSGYGCYIGYGKHFNIEKNLIKRAGTYGIYMFQHNSTTTGATGRSRIVNNMITGKGAGESIYFSSGVQDIDFFHNSLHTEDTYALYYVGTPNGMSFRNNIFYAKNFHVVDFSGSVPAGSFDYNILYRETSGNIAEDGTYQAPDLAAWKLAQPGNNGSSIQADPNFVDAFNNDLHVVVGPGLVAGDNTVGVMEDFDGDVRPLAPTTTVDIGADEILVQNLDAGIVNFDSPLPPVTTGLNPIQVSIKNNGITNLTGVTVNWTANGVLQNPFSWTGNLAIGEEANAVAIGNYNITPGFTQFVIWTSAPNGGTDQNMNNDTLVFDLCTPLSGALDVGGATPDFNTIQEAADAFSFCGVSGAVTVSIAPGTYNEAITLEEAPGASSTNTITFDGGHRDSVLITHVSNTTEQNATVLFNGGDYYTFKNTTIENTGTTYAWAVRFQGGANFNTLDNNLITVDTNSTSSSVINILASASKTSAFSYGDNANNTTISNNTVRGGYYGVRLNGATGSQAALNSGNVVDGNEFMQQYYYGIYSLYQNSPEFLNNTIHPLRNSFSYGILCGEAMLAEARGNHIMSVGTYGIYFYDVNFDYTANKPAKIINNMVKTTGTGDAFYLDDCNKVDIFHNTGRSENDQAFYTNDVTELNIQNNIFITDASEAFEFLDAVDAATVIDYNIYERTDGGDLIEIGTATPYADLSAWTTAAPTLNPNSYQGDPLFADEANGDFHVIGALANDNGNNVGITVDIDGDTRPAPNSAGVDIGADEYTPLLNDLNLVNIYVKPNSCNVASDSVWAVVQSLGLTPATAFNVTTNVTGGVTATLNSSIATNLALADMDTVYIGSFNSSAGGFYYVDAFISLTGDQNNSNDTSNTVTVQRMAPPSAVVTDVACFGDSTGIIDLDFVGTGTIATVDETIYQGTLSSNMSFAFAGLQGISGVTLEIIGEGDLDGTAGNLEEFAIYDENGNYIGQYGAFGNFSFQCAAAPANVISIPDTTYANWAADGVITFTAVPTSAVNLTLCGAGGDWLQMKLSGNGTPDLLWSNGDTTETITGLAAGNYTVTVTDLLGCTQTASFTVNQSTNPAPTLAVNSSTDVSCYGLSDGAIDVSASGGTGTLSYAWSNNATTEDLSGIPAGSYTVVVTDVNGCTDSNATAIVITQPDTLVATAASSVVGCDSVEVATTIAGGTMPYSYSWSPAGTGATYIATMDGSYDVTVTDANGCTDNATMMVTLPTALAATAVAVEADTAGAGVGSATVTATDGTAPYTYLWSNGDTTTTATSLSGGIVTVTVTDANGCTEVATVTVPFPTGAENWTVVGALDMFPNPTNGLVTFNVSLLETSDLTITIMNVAGQEVATLNASNTNQVTKRFDTSHLAEGVYMVRFIAGDDVITKRLVVGR